MTDTTHDCCTVATAAPRLRAEGDALPGVRPPAPAAGGSLRWSVAANFGAVVTAILASACCVGPLVLALLGVGGAGLLVALEPYRPYFMALTFALLGTGFYLMYRKPAASPVAAGEGDACGCPAPRTRRAGKIMLWVAAVLVVAFLAFPHIATLLWG